MDSASVALKMVQNWALASLDTIARFHLEAKAAAKLDHPRIVPIYETGEHNGRSLSQRMTDFALSVAKDRKRTGASAAVRDGLGLQPGQPSVGLGRR